MSKPYQGWILPDDERKRQAYLTMIELEFDRETDEEEAERVRRSHSFAVHGEYARRVCLIKTILFPMEFLVGAVFGGPKYIKNRWADQKVMLAYLRGKMSYVQFVQALAG